MPVSFIDLTLLTLPWLIGPPPPGITADAPRGKNLLVNGGFEHHAGIGTVPTGWQAIDENFDYTGWIAPRCERFIGGIGPRSGRYMAGLDTELLGVDTDVKGAHIPRAALYQTITVPGRCQGTFSLYYNDLGSTALAYVSQIRLGCTVNEERLDALELPPDPRTGGPTGGTQPAPGTPGIWSKGFHRVSQDNIYAPDATGGWTLAELPVRLDLDEPQVRLTLWIGVFEPQNSTEVGYWRIDDAAFILISPGAQSQP